ncbi:GIY-YIG nuclease family protein [Candidatus Wolfebacteria bacterium]|nr:GIY-YIG nuclease family protein [Candidatus Wolfebacteria bacterium]
MKTSVSKLLNKAKKFPDSPGVYWFSEKNKKIYVGRATSLKKRIPSYFRNPKDPRISEMVERAANVSFKKTGNLLEAVILEANLIKKYSPKYNVKEKDNRSFLYLVVPVEPFPRPFIARAREVEKYLAEGNQIFGPFESYQIIKSVLNLVRRIFPFSACLPNQGKPCFDYQIGLCPGICVGAISQKEYKENIKNLILFFQGKHKRLVKKLKKENPKKLFALKHIEDVALINNPEIENLKFKIENFAQHFFPKKKKENFLTKKNC